MTVPLLALFQRLLQLFTLGDVLNINTNTMCCRVSADIKNVVSTTKRTLSDEMLRPFRCQCPSVGIHRSSRSFVIRENIIYILPQSVFCRETGKVLTGLIPICVPQIFVQSKEDIGNAFGKFSVFGLAF